MFRFWSVYVHVIYHLYEIEWALIKVQLILNVFIHFHKINMSIIWIFLWQRSGFTFDREKKKYDG